MNPHRQTAIAIGAVLFLILFAFGVLAEIGALRTWEVIVVIVVALIAFTAAGLLWEGENK
ncbi:MAG TPA: hypothetical protein VGQ94_04745 [Terriglobales bacterium]|nr:hypothetical protein [Terriglobales bacterium]